MEVWMFSLKRLAIAVPAVLVLAVAAAACGGDSNDNGERLAQIETQLQAINSTLEKTQLIAAMNVIDTAGFHAMDDDLQQASEINSRYLGTVRKVRQAVVATAWPAGLKEMSDTFLASLQKFEGTLEAEDQPAPRRQR